LPGRPARDLFPVGYFRAVTHRPCSGRALRLAALSLPLAGALALSGCGGGPRPKAAPEGAETGIASYYASRFHGRRTASGERYDQNELTAAHPTLPFGTRARVTHVGNGRSVEVRINDRGPWKDGRIVDLSRAAAEVLGFLRDGLARVRLEVLELPEERR
jgi:rare lipoprotein A